MEFIVLLKTVAVLLLLLQKHNTEGGFIQPQGHTLPDGLRSLDGSDSSGRCRQECLMGNICGECTGNLKLNSTLVDGVYPRGTIDTAQPDWAMDFFTVNRNGESNIRIGFDFTDRFIPREIELKLFNCELLGTAISNINVYVSLLFPTFLPPSSSPGPIGSYQVVTSELDCDSLTTITIPTNPNESFKFYFIEFSFSVADNNIAVYLAEIRFSDEPIIIPVEETSSTPHLLPTSTTAVSSSQLLLVTSLSPVLTLFSSSGTMPAPSITDTGLVTSTPLPMTEPTTASMSTSATTTITSGTEAAFIQPQGHTLPDGLQSLDGSDSSGICRQECLMGNICGECTGNVKLNSTLVDGVYPRGTIDTAQPDWAMDFFTVNRNGESNIRIGFDFVDQFILRGIELKLFNCQSLGTAIPNFNVYASLLFPTFLPPSSSPGPIGTYETTASDLDCTSLTTITIPTTAITMFRFYFIELTFFQVDSNTAIYLAEIRFIIDQPVVIPNEITSIPQLQSTSTADLLLPVITSLATDLLSTSSVLMLSSSSIIMSTTSGTVSVLTPTQSSSIMPTTTTITIKSAFSPTMSSPGIISTTFITSTESVLLLSPSASIMGTKSMLTLSSGTASVLSLSSSLNTTPITTTITDTESVVTTTPLPSKDVTQTATASLSTGITTIHTSKNTNTDTMSTNTDTMSTTTDTMSTNTDTMSTTTSTPSYSDTKQPMPTSTLDDITTPTSATSVPTSNPDDALANSGLTTIVGVLAGIIIALILIILIGAVVVALCRRKKTKRGNYNVKILPRQNLELNSFYIDQNIRQLPTTDHDDHYEVMYRGDLFSGPGYAEVNVNGTHEPIYSEVREKKHEEGINVDEDFYDTCVGGSQDSLAKQPSNDMHPYSTVVIREPPPVPKKTPELYRALKLEAKQKSNSEEVLVLKRPERSSSKFLTENSEMTEGEFHSESAYLDLSASVHSGLALLSKPVFENMDTNPEYECASATGSYMGEKSTYPVGIPISASCMELSTADNYAHHYDKPVSKSQMESNTYSSPKAVPVSDSDTDVIYTNPDAKNPGRLVPAIYDTVYRESTLASASNSDVDPTVTVQLLQTTL